MALLDDTIVSGQVGHLADHSQAWGKLNDWPNIVRDYGCVGDDSTNNTTNLQAAIDATANVGLTRGRGGTLVIPPGIYRTDQLTMKPGVRLLGLGSPAPGGNAAYGAVLSPRANSTRILFIDGDTAVLQEGFVCENVGFYSNGFTGTTGIGIYATNRWRLIGCAFTGPAGTPMDTGIFCTARNAADTASRDCAWWNVTRGDFRRCQNAMNVAGLGGKIDACNFVPESAQSGETAILIRADSNENSQSCEVVSCMFDGTASAGYGVRIQGLDNGVSLCKFEAAGSTGAGVRIEVGSGAPVPKRNTIFGNHFAGYGVGGDGVDVASTCESTGIFMNQFSSGDITNAGSGTQDFHNRKANDTWT